MKKCAERGVPWAQTQVARMHLSGVYGQQINIEKGLGLIRKAADSGGREASAEGKNREAQPIKCPWDTLIREKRSVSHLRLHFPPFFARCASTGHRATTIQCSFYFFSAIANRWTLGSENLVIRVFRGADFKSGVSFLVF